MAGMQDYGADEIMCSRSAFGRAGPCPSRSRIRAPRAEGGAGTSRAKSNHREGRAPARPCPLSHVSLHLPGRITYLSSPNAMHLPLRAYCTRADLAAWRRCAMKKMRMEQ